MMGPLLRSAGFWTTLIGIAVQIAGAYLVPKAQIELYSTAALTLIAYLVSRGVVAAAEARANANRSMQSAHKF